MEGNGRKKWMIFHSVGVLGKWILCSLIIGISIGTVGTLFFKLLTFMAELREQYRFLIYFLPLGGLSIVFLYRITKQHDNKGTNLVLDAIHSKARIETRVAPLIFVSTLITHMFGGSAGREGAALQIGGVLGNQIGKWFRFDDKDRRIMIMCGMSACFAAVFGTPMAASIFSMEVVSVGIMHYAALVPCVLSAFISIIIARSFGVPPEILPVTEVPDFSVLPAGKILVMAVLFAAASSLFCICLHRTEEIGKCKLKNPYLRIAAAGAVVVALTMLLGTRDYLGPGMPMIEHSFEEPAAFYSFLLKIVFTSVTLAGGFKGGEIVPSFFIGATLGSFLAPVFGLPVALSAACGMVSVFCGVTNCPITSLLIAIEIFGAKGMYYYLICIAISYLISDYHSLYHSQTIVYSKWKTEFINKQPD